MDTNFVFINIYKKITNAGLFAQITVSHLLILNKFNTNFESAKNYNHEQQSKSSINKQIIRNMNRLKFKVLDDPVKRLLKIIHKNRRKNNTDTLNTYDFN